MSEQKRVIAFGFFDGVHVGHAALMDVTKRRAAELGAVPTVLTFDTHPDNLVKNTVVPLINTPDERVDIIHRLFDIHSVVFIHFNETFMKMPWQQFAEALTRELDACHFVVGHDFCFGYKGEGTSEKLADYCAARGMGCDIVPAVLVDGERVSSTRIRQLISDGDIVRANKLLGHPHCLVDTVRYGYRLGTKLGTPTINMQFRPGFVVPRFGVYAAKVHLDDGGTYMAVTNVGVRPTVAGEERAVSVESYILDYSGNLYEHRVRVDFYLLILPEQIFSGVE